MSANVYIDKQVAEQMRKDLQDAADELRTQMDALEEAGETEFKTNIAPLNDWNDKVDEALLLVKNAGSKKAKEIAEDGRKIADALVDLKNNIKDYVNTSEQAASDAGSAIKGK